MGLKEELKLHRGFHSIEHEALLNIYFTASCLKKKADEFFERFGLTDVQFNVLALLEHQGGEKAGLSQAELSDMMLVNRANITSLIDRMERTELVMRTAQAGDRRYNIVKMTAKGKKLFAKVEPLYAKQVQEVMSTLKQSEQKDLIAAMEKVRGKLPTTN
jgi:DNA-binding MarR family transcriptional regulator